MKPLYDLDEDRRDELIAEVYSRRGELIKSAPGTFGKIYVFDAGHSTFPRYYVAKCPRFKRFGNKRMVRDALEMLLHELEKTRQLLSNPWTNNFFDVTLFRGWPFVWSRMRDKTLRDLIDNPEQWTLDNKIVTLLLVARGLRLASEMGISAHQDLKPENVFVDDVFKGDVERKGKDFSGISYDVHIGDFGLCDAFREFGRNAGSRPYMAPEQYQKEPLDPDKGKGIDVFALGVIAHECLLGHHPIGELTSSIWPWTEGAAKKWKHERVWKKWARSPKNQEPELERVSPILSSLISRSMSPEPSDRPTIREFEEGVLSSIRDDDEAYCQKLVAQIEAYENQNCPDQWPLLDARIQELREFYATV